MTVVSMNYLLEAGVHFGHQRRRWNPKMKEGTKMTGDMRTMAIQLPEELFERLKAYLKKNNLKQKQFIIGLIEDALEQEEEDTAEQPETEESDEPDMDAEEE